MEGYSLLQIWLAGVFGLFLGVPIGMLTMGLCQMASENRRKAEKFREQMRLRLYGNWEEN